MSEDDPERRVGELIASKYRLQRLLGAGGMGAVYAAEHTFTKRKVAVKLMHESFAKSKVLAERFIREAQAPSAIGHPGIVEVLDGGIDEDGGLYLVLEMLDGETLADNDGAMPLPQLIAVSRQLLEALAAAHAAGFVHRDIKPDNVFLARDGHGQPRVKLLDFGVAGVREAEGDTQLTRTGTVLGTPMFMSPEQARGERVDHRSDIWAVGAIMYDALAGHPPYTGDTYNALIVSIVTREHVPLSRLRPDLPRSLLEVIGRALRKPLDERFASAEEMIAALDAIPAAEARSGVVSRRPDAQAGESRHGATRAARPPRADRQPHADGVEGQADSDAPTHDLAGEVGLADTRPSNVDMELQAVRSTAARAATRPSAPGAARVAVPRPRPAQPAATDSPGMSGGQWLWIGGAGLMLVLVMVGVWLGARTRNPETGATPAVASVDVATHGAQAAAEADAQDAAEARAQGAPKPQPEAQAADPQPQAADATEAPPPAQPERDPAAAATPPEQPVDPIAEQDRPLGSADLGPALAPHQPAVQRCYEDSLADMLAAGGPPPAATRLDVTLTVSSSGAVRGVGITGDAPAALVACVRGKLLSARFRRSTDRAELKFPLVFQPNVIGQ